MSKISFLTFASSDWKNSPKRFKSDLLKIKEDYNYFDKEFVWNENDLCEEYHKRFSRYFSDHGFGYFSWKPYCIKQALNLIDDGDFLLYLDSGCVLPMERIKDFLTDVENKKNEFELGEYDISLTTYIDRNPNMKITNSMITRKQILDRFGLVGNEDFLYRFPHYQAGLVLIRKNVESIEFLRRWYEFFNNNYETCIRSEYRDKTGQCEEFIQNGSDQSILQCMLFSENMKILNMNFFYDYNVIAHRIG